MVEARDTLAADIEKASFDMRKRGWDAKFGTGAILSLATAVYGEM